MNYIRVYKLLTLRGGGGLAPGRKWCRSLSKTFCNCRKIWIEFFKKGHLVARTFMQGTPPPLTAIEFNNLYSQPWGGKIYGLMINK